MSTLRDSGPGDLPPVDVQTTGQRFENAIREYGIVNACEWFGHAPDSGFTQDTISDLRGKQGLR